MKRLQQYINLNQANEWITSIGNVFSKELPIISALNWYSELGLEDEEFYSDFFNMESIVLIYFLSY